MVYQTKLFGPVKIVGRDVTGKILIEATERMENRLVYPFSIEPGYREWVSHFAIEEDA